MIGQLIAALVGTYTFSVLFGVPRRNCISCGLIGMAGWGIYLLCGMRFSDTIAVLLATMFVVFLSRLAAVWHRCPATIFLIAGIFPLVPGAGVYWTTYYIVMDQLRMAAHRGFSALQTAVAIVLGIVFIFELPQVVFLKISGLLPVGKHRE